LPKDALLHHKQKYEAEFRAKKMDSPPDGTLLPHRIIIFRDGVSEGEFQRVFEYELTALKGA
jgi:hypothetical protein